MRLSPLDKLLLLKEFLTRQIHVKGLLAASLLIALTVVVAISSAGATILLIH